MATDIKLDVGGDTLVLDGRVVKLESSDFMLDFAQRRKGGPPFRRALVHDFNDGLTINFNGDYPGGIALINVAQIVPQGGTLVVHGGISYEVEGVALVGGGTRRITVNLEQVLSAHQTEIDKLTARITALEAK